jgi:DNA primase
VLFSDEGITKGELASYYEMIAPSIVPTVYPKRSEKMGLAHFSITSVL